ncbi:MAG TPA: hypothetical protein VJZ71_14290 [Phycisphaerae bacterium]|nr:hypothetical protein [Phycisphaerae bacterium]
MTHRINRQLRNVLILIHGSIFFSIGCGPIGIDWSGFLPPTNISKETTFVVENSSRFSQDPSDAFAYVVPGEVRDDLSKLSGCWGSSYVFSFLGIPVLGYDMYSFDPSSGKMRFHQLQGPRYIEHTADYVLASPNMITVRNVVHFYDGKDQYVTEGPISVLLTLQADRMKIAFVSLENSFLDGGLGEPDDVRVPLVFKAFDCPE